MSLKPNAEASLLGFAEVPLTFNSVETIPYPNASAAFQVDSGKEFKEDTDIAPVIIDKSLSYIPWGGDNCRTTYLGERNRLPASVAIRRAVLSGMPGFSMIGLKPVLVRLKCPFSSTRTTMSLYLTMRYSAS